MKKTFVLACIMLLLAACGRDEESFNAKEPIDEPASSDQEKPAPSGEEQGTMVSGREILVALEQTSEPVKREEAAAAVKETTDFKEGYLGDPTEELAEDLAVQQIEAEAVYQAVEEVYGGHTEFEKIGEIFYENQTSGAKHSGIWIGIKNPDERIDKLAEILQKQVDAGEILAEPIYIYKIAHTRADLDNLMYQAAKKVKPLAEAHPNQDSVSYSISADTITGAIEIGHNFLTKSQIKDLKNAFPDREVIVEQEGAMIPLPGEPTVKYPESIVTAEPSDEGYYIVSLEDDRFLAVEAASQDFGENGGQDEFYSAIDFAFDDAKQLLGIGQRVNVEASGEILESYPGQGRAILVEVLPTYQPDSADLTEAEVVKEALEKINQEEFDVPAIRSVTYNAKQDNWTVTFKSWDQEIEKIIKDIK